MIKCNIPGCDSNAIKLVVVNAAPVLTCEHGHFLALDYSPQLSGIATEIHNVSETISAHMTALRKQAAEPPPKVPFTRSGG